MTPEHWLNIATHGLALEAAARVRAEYLAHLEDALEAGESAEAVLREWGDPHTANRELSKAHLTTREARYLPAGYAPTAAGARWRWPRFAFSGVGSASPQGNRRERPVDGSQRAAFSHSASVGRRPPVHAANASASKKQTWTTASAGFSGASTPKLVRSQVSPSRHQNCGAARPASARCAQPRALQSSGRE